MTGDMWGFLDKTGALPGLNDTALTKLERAIGCALPDSARTLLRRYGGITSDAWDRKRVPMRLMTPDDIVDTHRLLFAKDGKETYGPSTDARYLFTDDNSNWAGIFTKGPLVGKITLLDHEDSWPIPHYFDLASFAAALGAGSRKEWQEMQRDYPLRTSAPKARLAESEGWARTYLARAAKSKNAIKALTMVKLALQVLPPSAADTLSHVLREPRAVAPSINPNIIRYAALIVAEHQVQVGLVDDIAHVAMQARREGNSTVWAQAYRTLLVVAPNRAKKEEAAAPKNWRI
jgi:hypothetical protein